MAPAAPRDHNSQFSKFLSEDSSNGLDISIFYQFFSISVPIYNMMWRILEQAVVYVTVNSSMSIDIFCKAGIVYLLRVIAFFVVLPGGQ